MILFTFSLRYLIIIAFVKQGIVNVIRHSLTYMNCYVFWAGGILRNKMFVSCILYLVSTFLRSFYTFEACRIPTYYPPVLFSPRPETLSSGLEENTSFIFIRICTFIELILFEQNMVYKIKPVSSFCPALSLIVCPSLYYLCEMSSVSLPCNLSFFLPDGSSLLRKV